MNLTLWLSELDFWTHTHTHTLILVLGFGLCNVKFSTKSLLSSNHRVKSGLAEVEVGV